MPPAPLPAPLRRFLEGAHPAVVATVRHDGSPVTAATWYGLEGDLLVLTMDTAGARQRHLRRHPALALTVPADDWYHQLSLDARVVAFRDDADLADIDALSRRYRGEPYDDREIEAVTALAEIIGWRTFGTPGGAG